MRTLKLFLIFGLLILPMSAPVAADEKPYDCNLANPTTLEVAEYIQDKQRLYKDWNDRSEAPRKTHPLTGERFIYNVDGKYGICAAYYVANEIIAHVRSQGWNKDRLWKVYLAMVEGESRFDMYAYNYNTNGTSDNCMAQINSIHAGPGQDVDHIRDVYDFHTCIKTGVGIWTANLHGASNYAIKNSMAAYNGSRRYIRYIWPKYETIERELPDWEPVREYSNGSKHCSIKKPTEFEEYIAPFGFWKEGSFYCRVMF